MRKCGRRQRCPLVKYVRRKYAAPLDVVEGGSVAFGTTNISKRVEECGITMPIAARLREITDQRDLRCAVVRKLPYHSETQIRSD